MSLKQSLDQRDLRQLHESAGVLHAALTGRLGDLLPPYVDEVLTDLQELTEHAHAEPSKIRALVEEAASVMEMLPSIPPEWDLVDRAAIAARVRVK